MPGTQLNLVSPMYVNAWTRGVSAELAGYLRSEYGAGPGFARTLVEWASRDGPVRTNVGARSLVQRLGAKILKAFATSQAAAGGA